MELDLDIIEQVVIKGLHELKQELPVTLNADYYWHITKDNIHDIYNMPDNFTIGQLSEDYDFICKAFNGNYIVRQDLIKVAALLCYIAEM